MKIRRFHDDDEAAVVALWRDCDLTRPWNDPHADIARKRKTQPELFVVGQIDGRIVATAMAGYDGHRGAIWYVAVAPDARGRGHARRLVASVERQLVELGCPKLNLMVRASNADAAAFWQRLGYRQDDVIVLGKRLIDDVPRSG